MCANFEKDNGLCLGDSCTYAHNNIEVLYHPDKYKTMFCEPPFALLTLPSLLYILTWLPYPTQNSLPLFEKSCAMVTVEHNTPNMNIKYFIYKSEGRITIF